MAGSLPVEIDGFRVLETLHAGGFGEVHRVSRPGLDAPLVMKVPRLARGDPPAVLACHEAERMLLAALRGPQVPRLVAVGDLSRLPYLVMEEVPGRPLAAFTDRAPLPPEEVARLGAAVARALAAIHAQGAIHLDLKPENVLVRDDGEAVLIDFGLARHADLPDLVAEEVVAPMGSPAFVSPEQLLGVRDEPRSDLFALGVILYELATGRLPFGRPGSERGLRRRLYRDPVPPCALLPALPPWLQEVVLWCLERDPAARPATAAHLAALLAAPGEIPLGPRARRTRRDGAGAVLLRWLRAGRFEAHARVGPPPVVAGRRAVLVAVATAHPHEARHHLLREAVRRVLAGDEAASLTCVSILEPPSVTDAAVGGPAPRDVLRHLRLLRRWAEPLQLPEARIRYHVLESTRPAEALLDYVRANPVHHVVVGAPPADEALKRLFGTVSSRLADDAPCDVTVVRYPR